MRLIENVGQAPRMYVMRILALIAVLQLIWAKLPPDLVAELPPHLIHYITAGLAVAGKVARVIKQFDTEPEIEDTQPMPRDED